MNVRRDGRVALLFSDPTGSGHSNPAQIFIRGIADCPPELTTSPAALEESWSMLFWRQPSSRAYTLPGIRLLATRGGRARGARKAGGFGRSSVCPDFDRSRGL